MELLGMLVIVGFGLIHLVLGIVLLVTGYRSVRYELVPRLRAVKGSPQDWAFSLLGGVGGTIVVALFCFLVASRSFQMVL